MHPIIIQAFLNAYAVVILWTNPATNADGTPCRDLGAIEFRHTFGGDTLHAWVPVKGREGMPDSIIFQLPPSSVQRTWSIWAVAYDTLGNASAPGNHISVTK